MPSAALRNGSRTRAYEASDGPMRRAKLIPLYAAICVFLVHLAANPHYGFFRDELYFIVCGFRPAWGYVDQPPLVPLLAAASQLFGRSLFLIRAVAALFAACSAYVTCLIAIELGGGVFAQLFAAVVVFFTPVLMSFGMKVSTDSPGLLLWPLAALCVLRVAKGRDPRWWVVAGAALGLAFQTKYSVLRGRAASGAPGHAGAADVALVVVLGRPGARHRARVA